MGKSTLSRMLRRDWQTELMLEEFEENPYLEKFYQNKTEYAFQLEMSFLAARYSQQRKLFQSMDLFRSQVISDYMLQKCFVFSSANLSEEEFMIYRNFYHIIEGQLPKPELIVYLHRSPPVLLDQIKKRGRSYEAMIDAEYLRSIEKSYFGTFKQVSSRKVIILDLQKKDFESDSVSYERIKELINLEHKVGITRYKV